MKRTVFKITVIAAALSIILAFENNQNERYVDYYYSDQDQNWCGVGTLAPNQTAKNYHLVPDKAIYACQYINIGCEYSLSSRGYVFEYKGKIKLNQKI